MSKNNDNNSETVTTTTTTTAAATMTATARSSDKSLDPQIQRTFYSQIQVPRLWGRANYRDLPVVGRMRSINNKVLYSMLSLGPDLNNCEGEEKAFISTKFLDECEAFENSAWVRLLALENATTTIREKANNAGRGLVVIQDQSHRKISTNEFSSSVRRSAVHIVSEHGLSNRPKIHTKRITLCVPKGEMLRFSEHELHLYRSDPKQRDFQSKYMEKAWISGMANSFVDTLKGNYKTTGDSSESLAFHLSDESKLDVWKAITKAKESLDNNKISKSLVGVDSEDLMDFISFQSRVDGFKMKCLDPSDVLEEASVSNLVYFNLPISSEEVSLGMRSGKNTLCSEIENKDFYEIQDEEFYHHSKFGQNLSSLLWRFGISVVREFGFDLRLSYLWRILETNGDRENRFHISQPGEVIVSSKRRVKKDRPLFKDWFSVLSLSPNRCVLAVRKDIFVQLSSVWMVHMTNHFPQHPQMLKHLKLPTRGFTATDRVRKYSVLRKMLYWLHCTQEWHSIRYMLSPDHVDFDEMYGLLWKIIGMWGSSLSELQEAMDHSYENRDDPSFLASVRGFIMMKKMHVVSRAILEEIFEYLMALKSGINLPKGVTFQAIKQKHPKLIHILTKLIEQPTSNDFYFSKACAQKNVAVDRARQEEACLVENKNFVAKSRKRKRSHSIEEEGTKVCVKIPMNKKECTQSSNVSLDIYGRTRGVKPTSKEIRAHKQRDGMGKKKKARGWELDCLGSEPIHEKTFNLSRSQRSALIHSNPIYENTKKRKIAPTTPSCTARIPRISDLHAQKYDPKYAPGLDEEGQILYRNILGDRGALEELGKLRKSSVWNARIEEESNMIGAISAHWFEADPKEGEPATKRPKLSLGGRRGEVAKKVVISATVRKSKAKKEDSMGALKKSSVWSEHRILAGSGSLDPSVVLNSNDEEFITEIEIDSAYIEECTGQWYKLGGYVVVKAFYAVCACPMFPLELRKKLFLSLGLIEIREHRLRRKEMREPTRLPKKTCKVNEFGCAQMKDSESLKEIKKGVGIELIEKTFVVELPSRGEKYVPLEYEIEPFKPSFTRRPKGPYEDYLYVCNQFQAELTITSTLGKIVGKAYKRDNKRNQQRDQVMRNRYLPSFRRENESNVAFHYYVPSCDWLWQDPFLFGGEDMKRATFLDFVSKEQLSDVDVIKHVLAYLEYNYHTKPYESKPATDSNPRQELKATKYVPKSDKLNISRTVLPFTSPGKSYGRQLLGMRKNVGGGEYFVSPGASLKFPSFEDVNLIDGLFGCIRKGKSKVVKKEKKKKVRPDRQRFDDTSMLLPKGQYKVDYDVWCQMKYDLLVVNDGKMVGSKLKRETCRFRLTQGCSDLFDFYNFVMGHIMPARANSLYKSLNKRIDFKDMKAKEMLDILGSETKSPETVTTTTTTTILTTITSTSSTTTNPTTTPPLPPKKVGKKISENDFTGYDNEDESEESRTIRSTRAARKVVSRVKGTKTMPEEDLEALVDVVAILIKRRSAYAFHPWPKDRKRGIIEDKWIDDGAEGTVILTRWR